MRRSAYDCFLCSVGYESRARFFAEKKLRKARRCVAVGFTNKKVLFYEDNFAWYEAAGFEVLEPTNEEFSSLAEQLLREAGDASSSLRICLDVSSVTRVRLAIWIDLIRALARERPVQVDFVYSAARYSDPPRVLGPNRAVGPLPGFAGWSNPGIPLTVVVGVGYEYNKALGAVRYLDPEETWAFIPTGHSRRYARTIDRANAHLWEMISEDNRIYYHVLRPLDCLAMLESFVCGVLRSKKVTLLPFGPKSFALCCLLVACIHNDVPVWRVSSGQDTEPTDRVANGRVVGLRTTFSPTQSG